MNDGNNTFFDWEIELGDITKYDYIRLSHYRSRRRPRNDPDLPCSAYFCKLGTVIDVIAEGNCGFDCLGLWLQLNAVERGLPNTTCDMRKVLFDHAKENHRRLCNMSSLSYIYPPTADETWWEDHVLGHIYSEGTEYGIRADFRQWMQANSILPIFVDLYNTTAVLYDVDRNGGMTMSTFSPQGRSATRKVVVSSQDHFFEPPPDDSLAIIFYGSHFYLLCLDEEKEAPTQPFDTRSTPPQPNTTRSLSRQTQRTSRASGLGRSSTGTKAKSDTSNFHDADDFTLHSNLSDDCEGEREYGHEYPLTKHMEYVAPFFLQKEVLKRVVEDPYYETGDIPKGFNWNKKEAVLQRFHPRAVKKNDSSHTIIEGRHIPARPTDAPGCGRRQCPMAILMDAVVPNEPEASDQNRIHLLNLWYFALTKKQQRDFFELLSTMYFAAPTLHNNPLPASDALRQAQLDRAKAQGLAATKNPIIVTLASDRQAKVDELVARSFSHQVALPEKRRKKSDLVKSNAQLNDKVARRAQEMIEKKLRDYHKCTRIDPYADVAGESIGFCVIRKNVPIPRPRGGQRRKGVGEKNELMDHWLTVVFCKTEEEGRREIGAEKLAEYEEMGEVVFTATFGNSPYMAKQRKKRRLPSDKGVDEVAANAKDLRPHKENAGQGEGEMPPLLGATIEALSPRTPNFNDMRPILQHRTPESATYESFMM